MEYTPNTPEREPVPAPPQTQVPPQMPPQQPYGYAPPAAQPPYGYAPNYTAQPPYGYAQQPAAWQPPYPPQSAAAVYYQQTQANAGAPQYHYGPATMPAMNAQYYYQEQQRKQARRARLKEITAAGTALGLIVLASYLVQNAMSIPLLISQKVYELMDHLGFYAGYNIFYSALAIGLVFYIGGKFLRGKKMDTTLLLNKPEGGGYKTLLLVLFGLGGCFAANFATSYLSAFFEMLGFTDQSTSGMMEMLNNAQPWELIVSTVGTALLPPLTEELAMRGIVMQPLRKYGDAFAILASAFCFGLFHGNFTQIPFAFLCGLFLGYAVCATNSLLPSIIIHVGVNLTSCVAEIISYYADEDTGNRVYEIIMYAMMAVGLAALLLYAKRFGLRLKKEEKTAPAPAAPLAYPSAAPLAAYEREEFTLGEKFRSFMKSPAVIIVTVLYLIQAFMQVSYER